MVQANWAIVEPTLADQFNPAQREMVRGILRKLTTEEWYPKILAQMQKMLPDLHVARENIVFISGIGCSERRWPRSIT